MLFQLMEPLRPLVLTDGPSEADDLHRRLCGLKY